MLLLLNCSSRTLRERIEQRWLSFCVELDSSVRLFPLLCISNFAGNLKPGEAGLNVHTVKDICFAEII